MKKYIFLLLMLSPLFLLAQVDKAKMEAERKQLQRELKDIQAVYNDVKGQKRETIGQLNLIQRKIAVQNQYIGNINKEIKLLNNDIYLSQLEINKLNRQLDTLKQQYARTVVYAYKNRSSYSYLNFLFSAASFRDALKRVAYLRAYRNYRERQVGNILETQKQITARNDALQGKKVQKGSALTNQTAQLKTIEEDKKEKDVVISKLKSKEGELAEMIANRRKKDAQLKAAVTAAIRREIAERRKAEEAERSRLAAIEKERVRAETAAKAEAARVAKAAAAKGNVPATSPNTVPATTVTTPTRAPERRPAANTPTTTAGSSVPLTTKEVALSSNFAANKGKLPWPVEGGYVSIPYGSYTLPGTSLKDINYGLTLSTPSVGSPVKACFDGVVSMVTNDNGVQTVGIRHGKYLTVYSNLSGVSVGRGAAVSTGQVIGRTGADDEGGKGGKLDFMIYNDQTIVNPSGWLRR